MKTSKTTFIVLLLMSILLSCSKEEIMPEFLLGDYNLNSLSENINQGKTKSYHKATGLVEFDWKGGDKGSENGNQPENLLAFFEFSAHEGDEVKNSKGEITYLIKDVDSSLHREIKANVYEVKIDIDQKKGWFIGEVIYDSKSCTTEGDDHGSGCSGEDHTDHTNHIDGESDNSGHDGGCSHDDTGDDEGCSDHETGDNSHDGGHGSGNPLSGKNCRVGQLIVVKVHDGGTPGFNLDGLTWKWFDPNADFVPSIENIDDWPHLCKKTILEGNIVVHK